MHRSALLLAVVTLAACSPDATTAPRQSQPDAPNATWVFDTPRPSMISAEIVGSDSHDYNIVRVTFNDATDDESWDAFYFGSGFPVLNVAGVAGTGVRTADLVVPREATSVAVGAAWAQPDGNTLRTPYSAPFAITGDRHGKVR